jgi:hypothetical protein
MAQNIPQDLVCSVQGALAQTGAPPLPEGELRSILAFIKQDNPICCNCHKFGRDTPLAFCEKCQIAHYCAYDKACQEAHKDCLSKGK